MSMSWDLAAAIVLRPFLYLLLLAGVVYWLMKLAWKMLPAGKVRTFLFTKRDGWQQFVAGWLAFGLLLAWIAWGASRT